MTLREQVRKALEQSTEPDPKVISTRLLMRLGPEDRDQAALFGLMAIALVEIDQQHLLVQELERQERSSLGRPGGDEPDGA